MQSGKSDHKLCNMSSKRKRTAAAGRLHINNIPNGLLVDIASYLAKPSVALFAMAMNSPSTQVSKTILSSTNWSVLDFGSIEISLAEQLSDDDIDKILRSIDAVNNLRILILAGCISIRGRGLNLLRSATGIIQIDLSLVEGSTKYRC